MTAFRPARIDGRTRLARRASELRHEFCRRLGLVRLPPGQHGAAIQRAAELVALAEQERAKAIRGEPISLDDLVRLERLAASALRHLDMDKRRDKPGAAYLECIGAVR